MRRFRNRREAGRLLASGSRRTPAETDVVVLAVPLGGASVGYEVARVPGVALDVTIGT
jgi:predicted phosphoribosyltransferase